jgi:hypothetical protein
MQEDNKQVVLGCWEVAITTPRGSTGTTPKTWSITATTARFAVVTTSRPSSASDGTPDIKLTVEDIFAKATASSAARGSGDEYR